MGEGELKIGDDAGAGLFRVGQVVNGRIYAIDQGKGDYGALSAVYESLSSYASTLLAIQARESYYYDSFLGRKQALTLPGNTNVTGTTTFTATAPQVLLQAGAAGNELIINRIRISLVAAAGATPVRVHLVLDSAARYSSGGTSRTPSNIDGNYGPTDGQTHAEARDGAITATAAGAGTRDVGERQIINASGNFVEWEWKDGLMVPTDGTLLIYVMGGTSAPTFTYEIVYADVSIF